MTGYTETTQTSETEEVVVAPGMNGVNPEIHPGQQGKHVPGHNNHDDSRSSLNEGENPQELLDGALDGTHPVVSVGARGQPVVDFGRPIGVDANTGLPTQYGTIHSGLRGSHIVPANPNTVGS